MIYNTIHYIGQVPALALALANFETQPYSSCFGTAQRSEGLSQVPQVIDHSENRVKVGDRAASIEERKG